MMQDYNFVLDYISREINTIVDTLSHREDLNEGVSTKRQILLPNSLFQICKSAPHTDNDNNSLLAYKIFLKDNLKEQ